jgi:hypothetical protein
VFDPARPGHDLGVFQLVAGHFGAGVIEDHEPGAGGALIDGPDEISHGISFKRQFIRTSRFAARLTMYIL